MSGSRRAPVRLFVMILGGEGLQSLFHLVLNLLLVRHLSAHAYGVFSIIFLVGGISLTYLRALAGAPATIFIPQSRHRRAAAAYDVAFGTVASALAAAIGAALAFVCFAWTREPGTALFGGTFVAAWSLRSYLRLAAYAHRRPVAAGLGDAAFLLVGVAALPLALAGEAAVAHVFAALTLANAAGAFAIAVRGGWPKMSLRRSVRRRYRALSRDLAWSALGTTTTNAQVPVQLLLIAGVAGAAAYAPIAALFVVFAPLRIAATALVNVLQPEFSVRLAGPHRHGVPLLVLAATGLMSAVSLVYAGVLDAAFPLVRTYLFASMRDAPVARIAVLLWAAAVLATIGAVPRALLEAAGAFRMIAAVTAWGAGVGLLVVLLTLRLGGPVDALLGLVLSELVITIGFFAKMGSVIHRPGLVDRPIAQAPSPQSFLRTRADPSIVSKAPHRL